MDLDRAGANCKPCKPGFAADAKQAPRPRPALDFGEEGPVLPRVAAKTGTAVQKIAEIIRQTGRFVASVATVKKDKDSEQGTNTAGITLSCPENWPLLRRRSEHGR